MLAKNKEKGINITVKNLMIKDYKCDPCANIFPLLSFMNLAEKKIHNKLCIYNFVVYSENL